jgi:hypothetical protein
MRRYRGDRLWSWYPLDRPVHGLHPLWVHWKRKGRCIVYTLRPRGRAILDGEVPARIFGFGPYLPGRVQR